jgi:DNA invertase Pin-like site-specific DNA recombinase
MGTINTAIAQRESDIRSERVKAAVERKVKLGKRTGGGSLPFGYKIIYHDLGEGSSVSVASSARSWNRLRPTPSARLSAES